MHFTQTVENRVDSEQKFFGRLLPSGSISLAPKWLLRARMTATAIMFTGSAFAVAADGNQLIGNPPNLIPDLSIGETDRAQKIFGAEGRDFAVAYIFAREGRHRAPNIRRLSRDAAGNGIFSCPAIPRPSGISRYGCQGFVLEDVVSS